MEWLESVIVMDRVLTKLTACLLPWTYVSSGRPI